MTLTDKLQALAINSALPWDGTVRRLARLALAQERVIEARRHLIFDGNMTRSDKVVADAEAYLATLIREEWS